jgi:hypothetical protein
MENLLLYGIPALICLLFSGGCINKMVRKDLKWENCVTVGTVILSALMIAGSLIPVINIVFAMLSVMFTGLFLQEDIQRIFDKPICNLWRRK